MSESGWKSIEKDQKEKKTPEHVSERNQTGIPDQMRKRYEAVSGLSFDDVRVHYHSDKPAQFKALAYTQGNQVYVAPGQERHLGHELGHIIQQKQRRVRGNKRLGNVLLNTENTLEREADVFGRRAETLKAGQNQELKYHPPLGVPVVQREPIVDEERGEPFYVDSNYNKKGTPRFLLKKFVEMREYTVFQIRDHVQRLFWQKRDKDNYYTDRDMRRLFNIDDFMKRQPLAAWLEEFVEAEKAQQEIDGMDLSPKEKKRRKDAITNYVLQRYIVNALYRAEELLRMEYSGSPLSYQDRSTYMRSGAGSFADALKQLLLPVPEIYGGADIILTRSPGILEELGKFFLHVPLHADASLDAIYSELEGALAGMTGKLHDLLTRVFPGRLPDPSQVKSFLEEYRNASGNALAFVDITRLLQGKDAEQQAKVTARMNNMVRQIIVMGVIRRMCEEQEQEKILWVLRTSPEQTDDDTIDYLQRRVQQIRDMEAFNQWLRQKADKCSEEGAERSRVAERLRLAEESRAANKMKQGKKGSQKEHIEALNLSAGKLIETAEKMRKETPDTLGKKIMSGDVETISWYAEYLRGTVLKTEKYLRALEENVDQVVVTGGMISLHKGEIRQSALLLAGSKLDIPVKTAVNKAGYVPSITEALRAMMNYHEGEEYLSMRDIAARVLEKQIGGAGRNPGNLLKAIKETGFSAVRSASGSQPSLIQNPAQYSERNKAGAMELARVLFDSFCRRLVFSPEMQNPRLRAYYLQASAVKKLIDSCKFFENPRIPAFVWYQMDYYLEAAFSSVGNLADYVRNIQALHEIILLGIEMQMEEATRKSIFPLVSEGMEWSHDKLYQGAHLADYGLKAFAQVYDAAVAQHQVRPEEKLNVTAFYNIYFELTDKLRATVGAEGGKVNLNTPSNVAQYLGQLEKHKEPLPDIIMIDIHPNDATKEVIASNDVIQLLRVINSMLQAEPILAKKITVMVDITLNQATDEEIKGIETASNAFLRAGWLNLVFVQSLTKFAQMGMDKHSGGLVFAFNRGSEWKKFNENLQRSREADPVDPYMQKYFELLFQETQPEQLEYIQIIRANTRYVQEKLTEELTDTAITLSKNNDPGSCYVAWHYRPGYSRIRQIFDRREEPMHAVEHINSARRLYELHQLNMAVLEKGINSRMARLGLPVAMRFSFGFPISNLGETGDEVRFTIGTESHEQLDRYIGVITSVGERLEGLIRAAEAEVESVTSDAGTAQSVETLLDIKKLQLYLEDET